MKEFDCPRKLDLSAVLKGAATAIVLGLVFAFVCGLIGFVVILTTGISAEAISSSILLAILGFVVGFLPDLIGGYVTACDAGYAAVKHGLATGVVLLICSAVFQLLFVDSPFTWLGGIYFLLVVPVTALGGFLVTKITWR